MLEKKTDKEEALEEIRLHLQEVFGIPIALRRDGDNEIHRCPYCQEPHSHGTAPGHRVAHCGHPYPDFEVVIGDRSFHPSYGYTIYHYDKRDGHPYTLIDHKASY